MAGKVGGLSEGAALQSSREAHQLRSGHILAQRILSRPGYFAFDLHRGGIDFRKIAVNEDAVLGLERNVVRGIACQGALQIHAEHLQLSTGGAAKDLRVREQRIAGYAARQVNGIAQAGFSVGDMFAGRPHFPAHGNDRRVFEIISAEDAHGIEGLERDVLGVGLIARSSILSCACQRIGKIECNHLRRVVRRSQPDDFGVARRGLGQEIGIGMDEIGNAHAFAVGVLAGMENMAVEINGLLAVGQDGRDADLVAILNLEIFERAGHRFLVIVFRQIEPQHGAAFVGDHALHFDVAESSGVEYAAGELQRFGKIAFVIQFIDRGTAHAAFDRQLRAQGWNHDGIAGLQPLQV